MDQQQLLTLAWDFATAILLGALIGIEREKRKQEDDDADYIAGLRTFTLIALLGAATAWLSKSLQAEWILPVVLLILGVLVVAGYTVTAKRESFGLTTEIAAVVVFLLAAMVMYDQQVVAVALAVVTAAILAYKQPLHSFVDKLGWDDVYAGVRLLIATFHRAAAAAK